MTSEAETSEHIQYTLEVFGQSQRSGSSGQSEWPIFSGKIRKSITQTGNRGAAMYSECKMFCFFPEEELKVCGL